MRLLDTRPKKLCSNQISKFGYIFEGLGMEHVHIFYGHLKYLTAIWYILWTFGIFCGYFVFFSRFGMYQEKSGNTDPVVKVYYKGKPNLISDIYKCKTMQYKHCMPPPQR
jgi:hypothetical protein